MLIRNILEESVRKFDEVKAVKWLKKKEIMERSYGYPVRYKISLTLTSL